jgi:hypothetical protein
MMRINDGIGATAEFRQILVPYFFSDILLSMMSEPAAWPHKILIFLID